jgi:hypothetical protein
MIVIIQMIDMTITITGMVTPIVALPIMPINGSAIVVVSWCTSGGHEAV